MLIIVTFTFLISLVSGCNAYNYPGGAGGNCIPCDQGANRVDNCLKCQHNPAQCLLCADDTYRVGKRKCEPCTENCVHCQSYEVCEECDTNFKQSFNNSNIYCDLCSDAKCDCNNSACTTCDDGYYFASYQTTVNSYTTTITACIDCPQFCQTCLNESYCLTCKAGEYMQDDFCYDCPTECICSNQTYCSSCISGYFLNGGGNCQSCPQLCECAQSRYCTSCVNGAEHNSSGGCSDQCGDLNIIISPCDEVLGVDYDGCTDDCQVEENFTCSVANSRSTCSFTGTLSMEIVSIQKQIFANELTIEFQLSPDLHLFKTVDPNSFFSFEQTSIESPSFVYNKDTSTFTATFSYTQTLHKEKVKLLFNVSTDIDLRFYATDNHQWEFTVNPDNYLQAYFYTSEQYTFSLFIYFFTIVLVVLGTLVCIMGIFSLKTLAGLEIMLVLQYCLIILLWFEPPLILPVYCMMNFKYSTGYNYPIYEATKSTDVPKAQVFGINKDYFVSNFNAMLFLFIIVLIPLLVYKIKKHRSSNSNEKQQLEQKIQVFAELMLYVSIFNLTFLTACSAIFYMYGSMSDILSLVLSILGILFTISTFIGFFVFPGYSLRFRFSFRLTALAVIHYFFHIIYIISTVLLILFLTDSPWTPFIPQGLMLLYTLINKPYQRKSENFRSAFNYLTMCLITSIRLYFWLIDESEYEIWGSYIYPIIVELLILIGIIWAYVMVIKGIIKRCKNKEPKRNLAYDLFEDSQTIRKLERNLLNSDFYKAKNILSAFEPRGDKYKKVVNRQMNAEMKKNEKMSDSSTPKAIGTDKEMEEWLKSQNLPGCSQAMEMIIDETQFLRYQRIWQKKDYYAEEMNSAEKKIYDAI